MRRVLLVLAVLLGACIPEAVEEPPPDANMVAVAEELCPIMWQWQLNLGAVMNDMSYATRRLDEADDRIEEYLTAFSKARTLNAALDENIRLVPAGPYADLMIQDVVDGVVAASGIIDELESTVIEAHRSGAPEYGEMVPTIFLDFEKVIDVPKPELGGYGNAELIRAFSSVPQCQHGVKDANDGVPRYIPLG
jgi:hypothetical protein